MKWIVIGLISLYQKFISPNKGFNCAYRQYYGGSSCSEAVKQLIVKQGIWASCRDIQARFKDCGEAAKQLQDHTYSLHRSDLDCSLGLGDGCGDLTSGKACFGGGGTNSASAAGTTFTVRIGIVALLILVACVYWFYGRQIEAIDIRLISHQASTEQQQALVSLDKQLLDYYIMLSVNGKKLKTNTLKKTSAQDWLTLKLKKGIDLSDVDQLTIIDNKLLKDKVLEVLNNPFQQGTGQHYEYQMRRRWDWF